MFPKCHSCLSVIIILNDIDLRRRCVVVSPFSRLSRGKRKYIIFQRGKMGKDWKEKKLYSSCSTFCTFSVSSCSQCWDRKQDKAWRCVHCVHKYIMFWIVSVSILCIRVFFPGDKYSLDYWEAYAKRIDSALCLPERWMYLCPKIRNVSNSSIRLCVWNKYLQERSLDPLLFHPWFLSVKSCLIQTRDLKNLGIHALVYTCFKGNKTGKKRQQVG